MRFVKLVVEAYQAIERAEVEFGPGLNVLYGPNDIGKSTLAAALRSALLVPPSSTLAESFVSWYVDATPRVALTFLDESKRYWQIEKQFGSGAADAAKLSHSKDGASFTFDCRAREVEERVRAVLGWGIPGPGGKSAPKGLPTSFLASVLLAEQTDVHKIMLQSLEKDLEDSGKLRLTKALAVLAQDATFKQVLDIAQRQFDTYFTAKGTPKKGQASPFTHVGNKVKELQQHVSTLDAELTESTAIEELVVALRKRFLEGLEASTQAAEALQALRARAQRDQARQAARTAMEAAVADLSRVDAHAQRVTELNSAIETLRAQGATLESNFNGATAELDAAQLALHGAQEAHRIATGEGAARERELRRAQLAEKAASNAQRRQTAEARRERVQATLKARDDVAQAERGLASAQAEQQKGARDQAASRDAIQHLEREHADWVATAAYTRWRAAADATQELEQVTQLTAQCLAEAEAKDAEAAREDAAAAELLAQVNARQATLPTAERLASLQRLEHDLQLAEAALGGGLSVEIKGRPGLTTRATLDDRPSRELPGIDVEQHLEADRCLLLTVDDLVQIEVRAGAAEKRKDAEALRVRRKAELMPVLDRAGLPLLEDVARATGQLTTERSHLQKANDSIRGLRTAAQNLRDRATDQQAHAAGLAARGDDVATLRAALGDADLSALEKKFNRLGSAAQTKADAGATECLTRLDAARGALATLESAIALADFKLKEATERQATQKATYASSLTALETDNPDAALTAVDAELAAVAREQTAYAAQLELLAAESNTEVVKAAQAVQAGERRVLAAREAREHATVTAEAARQEQAARQGEHATLRAQLDAMDRSGLDAIARQRQSELAAFGSEPDVAATALEAAQRDVERLQREHDQIKEELHKAEGKLSNAGGAALRENVQRMREAHQRACDDESEVELDADAWKLLRQTLRDVEDTEGAHLGRALAGPLASQLRDLTDGRYRNLHLNPLLKVEGVDAAAHEASGADVLTALSAGIRDQLATLIRLAIAEGLGSAIILDDHLVHSDPERLGWFRQALMKAALKAQVVVLTCRPRDYLSEGEIPQAGAHLDLAGGTIRAIDLSRVVGRYRGSGSMAPDSDTVEVGGKARAS